MLFRPSAVEPSPLPRLHQCLNAEGNNYEQTSKKHCSRFGAPNHTGCRSDVYLCDLAGLKLPGRPRAATNTAAPIQDLQQEQPGVQQSDQGSTDSDAPAIIGTCDTAGPVEVEATAGTLGPIAYPDLASAIAAINAGTHQGAINVEICASTVETGAMFLNSNGAGSAIYTSVTIRPLNDGLTISGPTVTGRGLIELNGADNVTIDGDNPNTVGTNRNLTIQNTAANTVTFHIGHPHRTQYHDGDFSG